MPLQLLHGAPVSIQVTLPIYTVFHEASFALCCLMFTGGSKETQNLHRLGEAVELQVYNRVAESQVL